MAGIWVCTEIQEKLSTCKLLKDLTLKLLFSSYVCLYCFNVQETLVKNLLFRIYTLYSSQISTKKQLCLSVANVVTVSNSTPCCSSRQARVFAAITHCWQIWLHFWQTWTKTAFASAKNRNHLFAPISHFVSIRGEKTLVMTQTQETIISQLSVKTTPSWRSHKI